MQKLTKITSSIGPASADYETLKQMIKNGTDVCRLNFSHDTHAAQGAKFDTIRRISAELGRPVAIIADLQGPKHRIGDFATEDHYPLTVGGEFVFDDNPAPGDATRVFLPDADVRASLRCGERILLNDGKIEMCVVSADAHKIIARVVRGTEIWSRRGFNLPDTDIATDILTDKDRDDLEYAITKQPDFVALSFVGHATDIARARDFITAHTDKPIKIIAKIERPTAVAEFADILDAADGAMVARGDLAVEMPFWEIPAITRQMIRVCLQKNKPIIIATQMLGSMVHSEFPLRAEVSDVATAAYLRADATMTSEETTVSDNPPLVVDTMAKILTAADADSVANAFNPWRADNLPENNWSRSISSIAYLNDAAAIVVFDRNGNHSREISARRPDKPIIAVCNDQMIANQLCMSRGIHPIYDTQIFGQRDALAAMARAHITGDKIVIVDGESIILR